MDQIANFGTAFFLFEMLRQEKEEVEMLRFTAKEFMKGNKKPSNWNNKGRASTKSMMSRMDSNAVIGALSQKSFNKSQKKIDQDGRSTFNILQSSDMQRSPTRIGKKNDLKKSKKSSSKSSYIRRTDLPKVQDV